LDATDQRNPSGICETAANVKSQESKNWRHTHKLIVNAGGVLRLIKE
jgi:hypothetical protein